MIQGRDNGDLSQLVLLQFPVLLLFPYKLIPNDGLRPMALLNKKSKNLMETSVINIPGTNMARHMHGSRKMLTLNK